MVGMYSHAERGNKKMSDLSQHEYNVSVLFMVGMCSHAERGNKEI